jgi:Cu-Zn family superoxide dismutase
MRTPHLAGLGAIALLGACSTTQNNPNPNPAPGDTAITARRDTLGRDSLAARNLTDSAAAAARRSGDSMPLVSPGTIDTAAAQRQATAIQVRTTADSVNAITRDQQATVMVTNATGQELGMLTVTEIAGALSIAGTLRGLPPGTLGMHVHTVGRCDAPSFESAGGHWNPTDKQHGLDDPQGPHLGDLKNITVRSDSTANILVTTQGGSLRGTNTLLDSDGAALVVHTAADDQRSDPAGNSGGRLACGVIRGAGERR